jgi:DTW domain
MIRPSQKDAGVMMRVHWRRTFALAGLTAINRTVASHPSRFLDCVQQDATTELAKYPDKQDILELPPDSRNSLCVARALRWRIQALDRNEDCRRCWLQRVHCVCSQCAPLPSLPNIRRIFILMHHKEIGLPVDTAKFLMAAYPDQCRLVVGGLVHQKSLQEMQQAMTRQNCVVLFPSHDSQEFQDLSTFGQIQDDHDDEKWDIIVLDGTWAQARKLYSRYVPDRVDGGPLRVQLSQEAVETLSSETPWSPSNSKLNAGHQLRQHPTFWRQVSTLEATRLLLGDMLGTSDSMRPWDTLSKYQQIGDLAIKAQLVPPRLK